LVHPVYVREILLETYKSTPYVGVQHFVQFILQVEHSKRNVSANL